MTSMVTLLSGRLMTRGVSRPKKPARTHIIASEATAKFNLRASSILRLNNDLPVNSKQAQATWGKVPSVDARSARTNRITRVMWRVAKKMAQRNSLQFARIHHTQCDRGPRTYIKKERQWWSGCVAIFHEPYWNKLGKGKIHRADRKLE